MKYIKNKNNEELMTYMLGSAIVKVITFGMFFYMARKLTQSEMGQIEIYNTNINLFVPLISLQLGEACIRFLTVDRQKNKEYLTNIIIILLIQVSLMLISLFFLPNKLLIITCLLTIINNFIALYSRAIGKFKYFRLIEILQKSFLAILVICFINKKVEGYIYATILSLIMAIVIIGSRVIETIKIDKSLMNREIIVKVIKYILPLIINAIGWWLITSTDRYIIKYFYSDAEVGIYAVTTKIASILMLFLQNVYYVYQKRYINIHEMKKKIPLEQNIQYIRITIIVTLCSLLLPKQLILLILGKTFSESIGLYYLFVPTIMYWSFSVLFGLGYLISKRTRGASITTIIISLINVCINIILIPKLVIEGAIIATLISLFGWFIIRYVSQRKILNFKMPIRYWVYITLIQILSILFYLIY